MKPFLIAAAAAFFFGSRSPWILGAGFAAEACYLFLRGVSAGHLPLIGPHDTLVFFAASIAGFGFAVSQSKALRGVPSFSWGIGASAGLFTLLSLPFPAFDMPLPPILNTLWFEAHVALAFFSYALFLAGAVAAGLALARGERAFTDTCYRVNLTGYTFFSLSMVSGGIWGYYAWGTYWLWTAKELWTSILWLYYSLWLHLRYRWPGNDRLFAWASILGFAVTMFTYLGVSLLMKSSHSF